MIINLGHVQIWQQTTVLSRWQSKTLVSPGHWVLLQIWKNSPLVTSCSQNERVLTHSTSTPGESPAGFIGPGLSLSPLIHYRNLKTHIPAIPENPSLSPNLHRIRGTQNRLKIPGGWVSHSTTRSSYSEGTKRLLSLLPSTCSHYLPLAFWYSNLLTD